MYQEGISETIFCDEKNPIASFELYDFADHVQYINSTIVVYSVLLT